jgi:RNA polymerase sigma factor (sigma-70 family)
MQMLRRDTSDAALISACRRGDRRAWNQLVKRYERLVFSIPLNYGLSREDAADITQLTFSILIQSIDKIADDSRLGPWLAVVARRHTWRLMERNRRETTGAEGDLPESPLPDESSARSMERWELLDWLDQGLAKISDHCRELLLALYFSPEEPSYAEVAARLEMPVGSIGPTRARCLKQLREKLG